MSNSSESPGPTDKELNQFLDEIETDQAAQLEVAADLSAVDAEVNSILKDVGYRPLELGNDRYRLLYDEAAGLIRQEIPFVQPSIDYADYEAIIDSQTDSLLQSVAQSELAHVTAIKIYFVGIRNDLLSGQMTLDEAAEIKRQIMAQLIIVEKLETESPLLVLADRLLPGGHVDLVGEDMYNYYRAADAKLTDRDKIVRALADVVSRTNAVAGVDSDSLDQASRDTRVAIVKMVLSNLVEGRSSNSRANRIEQMHALARMYHIDELTAQKIIPFILTEFPIKF